MINNFEDMVGNVIRGIDINYDNDEMLFGFDNGERHKLFHEQYCCESVTIKEIHGDLDDLIGTPVLLADVITETDNNWDIDSTCTWTFYKISTIKGSVTITWLGMSNGYYSERVNWS